MNRVPGSAENRYFKVDRSASDPSGQSSPVRRGNRSLAPSISRKMSPYSSISIRVMSARFTVTSEVSVMLEEGFEVALAPFYDREDFRRFHVVISVSPLNSDGKAGFLLGTSRFGYIIRGRYMPWQKCRSFIRSMRPASQRQFVSIMTTIYVFRAFTYQQMSVATGRVIIGFATIANT